MAESSNDRSYRTTMNLPRALWTIALLLTLTPPAPAATVKISDLTIITAPSTNTFIEVADMDAVTKSRKYLLTNLVTKAEVNWVDYTAVDSEGGTVHGTYLVNPLQNGLVNIAANFLTNLYGAVSTFALIGSSTADIGAIAAGNNSIFVIGDGALGSAFLTNASSLYGFGDGSFRGSTTVSNSSLIYGFGRDSFKDSFVTDGSQNLYGYGQQTFEATVVDGSSTLFGFGNTQFSSSFVTNSGSMYVFGDSGLSGSVIQDSSIIGAFGYDALTEVDLSNSTRVFAYGYSALASANLTNSSDVFAYGKSAGAGLSGSYTNIYLWGTSAQPTLTANQHVFGSGTDNYAFPGSGSVTVHSGVITNGLTAGVVTATKAFRSYQGVLTHAGTVTIDFDATTTVNFLSLTGNVTFALSNLATNRTARLRIANPQATNCTITLPANTSTNFLGGAPTTITAGKVAMWSMEAWGANNSDVVSAWAQTQ